MNLDAIGELALAVAAVGQTAFVLLYMTLPWWSHFTGRALMLKSLALALILDAIVLGFVWDYPGEETVELCLYWLVAVAVWVQAGAILRRIVQRRRRDVLELDQG